jgi:pimeloyl-ACP methyl ester carboxylesterase
MSQAQTKTSQPTSLGGAQTARRGGFGGARKAFQTAARSAMVQAHEVVRLLSVPAKAPARLIRSEYGRAESLSPRAMARPAAARPVLLVHGFGGAKASWSLVAQALSAQGLSVDAMAYAPVGNSAEQLADKLVTRVQSMLSRTGAEKVHLVGHSLGGVIIAQAISDPRLAGRVETVITLGSPFGGSPWAGVLPFTDMVRALRPGSTLLTRLASTPLPEGVRWLSVTAALDIIVPGPRSMPPHAQVETVTVNGVGHLGMLVSPRVVGYIAAALRADASATAAEPAASRDGAA